MKRTTARRALAAALTAVALTAAPATAGAAPLIPEALLPSLPGVNIQDFFAPHLPTRDAKAESAADHAQSRSGRPYVWGATGPDSFDCSGLVQWSYKQVGIQVPRTSYDQMAQGTPVSLDALRPGDVIGYSGNSHVAMYIGNGRVIHAPTSGDVVRVADLYMQPVTGAVRFG